MMKRRLNGAEIALLHRAHTASTTPYTISGRDKTKHGAMQKPVTLTAGKSRSPRDGRPYFCTECGGGFAEYLACEDVVCVLETVGAAEARARETSDAV